MLVSICWLYLFENLQGVVAAGPDKKKLAEASRNALNSFIDLIRMNQTVDLSGKNLMEEGTAYISEGLAYNSVCKTLKLGSNGIGSVAAARIADSLQVLPSEVCFKIKLSLFWIL